MKNAIRWLLVPIIPFVAVAAVEVVSFVVRVVYGLVTTFDISAPRGFHESRDGLMMLMAMVFEGVAFVWSPFELAPKFKKAVLIISSAFAFILVGLFVWIAISTRKEAGEIVLCVAPFSIGVICATVSILKKGQ